MGSSVGSGSLSLDTLCSSAVRVGELASLGRAGFRLTRGGGGGGDEKGGGAAAEGAEGVKVQDGGLDDGTGSTTTGDTASVGRLSRPLSLPTLPPFSPSSLASVPFSREASSLSALQLSRGASSLEREASSLPGVPFSRGPSFDEACAASSLLML